MLTSNNPLPEWAPKPDDVIRLRRAANNRGLLLEMSGDPIDVVVYEVHYFTNENPGDVRSESTVLLEGDLPEGMGVLRIKGDFSQDMVTEDAAVMSFFFEKADDFEVIGKWRYE